MTEKFANPICGFGLTLRALDKKRAGRKFGRNLLPPLLASNARRWAADPRKEVMKILIAFIAGLVVAAIWARVALARWFKRWW